MIVGIVVVVGLVMVCCCIPILRSLVASKLAAGMVVVHTVPGLPRVDSFSDLVSVNETLPSFIFVTKREVPRMERGVAEDDLAPEGGEASS